MKDIFASVAEAKIKEAIAKGELKNLPGEGKPITIENMAFVPPEERFAFHIMKNAGIQPTEVSLKNELEELAKLANDCEDTEEKNKLAKKLQEVNIRYSIMMEKRRTRK